MTTINTNEYHEVQLNYLTLKAAYDTAFNNEDWDTVDSIEDAYIDAEFNLVEWAIDECLKAGMKQSDADFLKKNWLKEDKKIIELALKLKVN